MLYMLFHMYSPHSEPVTENGRARKRSAEEEYRSAQDGDEEASDVRTTPGDACIKGMRGSCSAKDYEKGSK